MIILDTNVLSALMLSRPDRQIIEWLDGQPADSIYTTSVTVFEIKYGIELLAAGRRRTQLESAFAQMLARDFEGHVLPFNHEAAASASTVAARRRKKGVTVDFRDTQVAGIAIACRATLATRNTRHFTGLEVDVVDPWQLH